MDKSIVAFVVFGLVLTSFSCHVEAQQPTKVKKIGLLSQSKSTAIEPFRQGMRELGYIEGQNIIIEHRVGDSRERQIELATELVRLKVDVIVALGTAVPAAKIVTGTLPIVFSYSGDPIEAGFIESFARPGRNMTGITWLAFELVGKRLEILKEVAPSVSRIAIVASPQHPGQQHEFEETQSTARALGTTLQYHQVEDTANLNSAFDAIIKQNPNALLTFADPVTNAHRVQIAEFAEKHRLPSMFGRKESVEAGGLISYGAQLSEVNRRITAHVDKILKGVKPAEVPTELPTRFELFINLKTAKQIGLAIPPNVLARADKVIK